MIEPEEMYTLVYEPCIKIKMINNNNFFYLRGNGGYVLKIHWI